MKQGDFAGKFKTAWDENFLYLLVQVVDDSLSDDHSNPVDSFWNDDCVEVFIDEDRSGGDQERNCNAFAYHTSLFYDAIDLSSAGQGINYNNNLTLIWTRSQRILIYGNLPLKCTMRSFNIYNPEASRVFLLNKKLMGFAIAYCDNDETTERENFIGSMQMTAAHNNDMYKNADYFGPVVLIDQDHVTAVKTTAFSEQIKIFPVPANDVLHFEIDSNSRSESIVSISSITGRLVKSEIFNGNSYEMNIENLDAGIYIVQIKRDNKIFNRKIVKK